LLPFMDPLWETGHNDICERCSLGGELLCCSYCNVVFHLGCLRSISALPEGEWACPACVVQAYDRAEQAGALPAISLSAKEAYLRDAVAAHLDAGDDAAAADAAPALPAGVPPLAEAAAAPLPVYDAPPLTARGRRMSARQLTSRPKEILPLEHQSHITDVDPRARNRSGRYGPMYLVEPRGTGAYVVAHSQWLERAAIAPAVFAAYKRRSSHTAAGVQVLFMDYVDTDPLRTRGVPQIPVPRTPAGTPPGTPPNEPVHPAATAPAPTGVWVFFATCGLSGYRAACW
jgi:hypothetical protein